MRTMTRRWLGALLIATGIPVAMAAETPAAGTPAPTASQQKARDMLLGMARFLGAEQKFSVTVDASWDALQANGQKLEFAERRELAVERPDRFRGVLRESGGRGDVMLFDGKNITISDEAAGVFAQAPQPGDLDSSIVYFVRDLGMRLPLAPLFMSHAADELQRRVRELDYVERSEVRGVPVHHLAGRTDKVDFQVWIRDGAEPLPLRLVLGYRNEPEHPQFRADLSDWNLRPRFAGDTFRFDPPKGSQRIVFLVQMVPASGEAAGAQQQQLEEVKP